MSTKSDKAYTLAVARLTSSERLTKKSSGCDAPEKISKESEKEYETLLRELRNYSPAAKLDVA